MRYSQKWWVIVALLFAFALTVSVLTAQTGEPSAVNAPSRAKVQADGVGAQASSDEPEQKQPTFEPNRDTASADVETDRRFNELRRELLDDRAKMLNWWLEATAIFLTLIGVAAAILGYFGFKRLDRIESEARENVESSEKHAQEAQRYEEEAQRYVEDIKTIRDKAEIDRAFSEAILFQQQNRTSEAIEKWRSFANIIEGTDDEREAQAWFSIGYLSSTRDEPDLDAAINAYDAALRLNPSNAEAYNNRGVAKRHLGQHEAAIADYDAALRLDSTYVAAYNNRGIAKGHLGQHEAAIADYDAALRLDSTYVAAYNNRGIAKGHLGQHEAAIADYDATLRLDSTYAEAYCNRGIAKGHLGQHEAAIADYDATLRLYPDFTDAYFRRGNAKVQLDRIDEARQDFEKALNLARVTDNADLAAQAVQALSNLDRGDAP